MTVKFFPTDKAKPPGKLADAELHFGGTRDAREWLSDYIDTCQQPNAFAPLMSLLAHLQSLDGLKLVGFAIWERKNGGRNVTFPARQYSVNGERRSFALLRPTADTSAQDKLRDLILNAFREHETELVQEA